MREERITIDSTTESIIGAELGVCESEVEFVARGTSRYIVLGDKKTVRTKVYEDLHYVPIVYRIVSEKFGRPEDRMTLQTIKDAQRARIIASYLS